MSIAFVLSDIRFPMLHGLAKKPIPVGKMPDTQSRIRDELRDTHRQWLQSVIDKKGVSASAIARSAGLTPSTLTKLLNQPDYAHALSSTTISKIVSALNVAPPLTPSDTMPAASYRKYVWNVVYALAERNALNTANPSEIADTIVDLADWLASSDEIEGEAMSSVIDFSIAKLKRAT